MAAVRVEPHARRDIWGFAELKPLCVAASEAGRSTRLIRATRLTEFASERLETAPRCRPRAFSAVDIYCLSNPEKIVSAASRPMANRFEPWLTRIAANLPVHNSQISHQN